MTSSKPSQAKQVMSAIAGRLGPSVQDRAWLADAIKKIEADAQRSADTHLLRVPIPGLSQISLYLKDESTHPTGSLKHRLARSLFLYGLCNGWIGHHTPIIEASSGSTAVSEAYFAQMLGLRFIAVMPRGTSTEKIEAIRSYAGECHLLQPGSDAHNESLRLAAELGGHFMDQFTYAERATDWRGNNNIAQSIFDQMALEPEPVPKWIVIGAGTGGTSATIGRYVRYRCLETRLCLADPTSSVFHQTCNDRSVREVDGSPSLIEGVGRMRCEPSFIPELIDRCYAVPDAASIGAAKALAGRTGRSCGGSTGTSAWAAATLMSEMQREHKGGSLVMLLCDSGERYRSTLWDPDWLRGRGIDAGPYESAMQAFFETGVLVSPSRAGSARASSGRRDGERLNPERHAHPTP